MVFFFFKRGPFFLSLYKIYHYLASALCFGPWPRIEPVPLHCKVKSQPLDHWGRPNMLLDCGMFIIYKWDFGAGGCYVFAVQKTRINNFTEKNGGNSSLKISCTSNSLPGNPQNCPQEFFLGEECVIMKFYHEIETISYIRIWQRMMLYKYLEFWKILNQSFASS